MTPTRAALWDALAGVRDPELDEPITELGFVAAAEVDGDTARVRLRLPTYFCAPNFAYLMVADARAALVGVPGVRRADVGLDDHFASGQINAGVAGSRGFVATFDGLADDELDELRRTFRRKALAARRDRLLRGLLAAGAAPGRLASLRLRDLPEGVDTDVYLSRRAELGLDTAPDAPLLVDDAGRPMTGEQAETALRRGRLTRLSIEGNAATCRAVLAARYPGVGDTDRSAVGPSRA
ncbi:MAG: iron-sulfur cluster assembly protein [Actinobacteria bacterium]|nr:iron-sulfur cluster assembly protein [Actinomycetota bacterium]